MRLETRSVIVSFPEFGPNVVNPRPWTPLITILMTQNTIHQIDPLSPPWYESHLSRQDLWRRFKQHAELMFTGLLKNRGGEEKCSFLQLWIGEKRSDFSNRWTLTGDEDKLLKIVESVVKMCARRSGEYKEEIRGPKKEEKPKRQLLDAVFNLQPRIVLRRADVSENLHPEQQQSVSCHIKEEGEVVQHIKEEGEVVQHIKEEEEEFLHLKEEEQEEIIQVPSTGVHLKSEGEGHSEARQGAALPSKNSLSDGECHKRGLQKDGQDNDEEQSEGGLTCHNSNKTWKCSHCRKAFATMSNFKRHVKIHTGWSFSSND
ncbi:uncharacterized protein LOC133493834 [Syngnathoides biaculeatus]|uniref:uncharacterized protein LOC133493834 n=1 Tax=Syngnathoides biaculeatus TaxID=300417 RepID=UPI002ADDF611|nr:uncharacterized protein LOC133493834 [Syngnathoides biaculeatus]